MRSSRTTRTTRVAGVTEIRRIRLALAAAAAAGLLLSGCGGGDEPVAQTPSGATGSPSTTPGSAAATEPGSGADIEFASGMIPHHGQAMEMAGMATSKAGSAKVKEFAEKVMAAQGPEITALSGLLSGWGEPVPAAAGHDSSMAGMDHGDSGMMSSQQMDDLKAAEGAEFDRMWVDMMIDHHEGAVTMSRTEVAEGANSQAKELAEAIIDAQTAEIAELKSLRTELS